LSACSPLGQGLVRHAVSLVLGASLAGASWQAEALYRDTLFLRANSTITYESNVFRLSDDISDAAAAAVLRGRGKSAFISALGAGARVDVPVSRQRFRADLSATNYQYSDFNELDYTGYEMRGIWDWRVGNDWHGELGAGKRQARRPYSSAIGAFVPPLYQSDDAVLDIRYALTARWELQAAANALQIDHQDEAFSFEDFKYYAVNLGVLYRTPRGNSLGARLRYEHGSWPHRRPASIAAFGNEYAQYTVSGLADWQATGRSRIYGDVGYTTRQRVGAISRGFDGPSGKLNYDYSLTGKTTLRASVYQTRGAVDNFTATYLKTTGLDLSGTYQATAKISMIATASSREQDYLGDTLVPGVDQRRDRLTTLGVEASYRATRTLSFSTGTQYDERRSSVPLGTYHIYTINLRAGIEF
jgi:exopolysaccharide biosynthesis operon protein EpsL